MKEIKKISVAELKEEMLADIRRKGRQYRLTSVPVEKEKWRSEYKGKVSMLYCVGMIDEKEVCELFEELDARR